MRQNANAKVLALPVEISSINVDPTSYNIPAFPTLIENTEQLVSWVGACDSCGYGVFSGDDYTMQDGRPVCPTCVSEQHQWKAVEVRKVA